MHSIFSILRLLTQFNLAATIALLAWLVTTSPSFHNTAPHAQNSGLERNGGQQ